MSPLLALPLPSVAPDALTPAAVEAERALLESLVRSAERDDVRLQALVELMGLEVVCGDELAFERLRHELTAAALPPPVATLFRARVAYGLARFGRAAAAARWARGAGPAADGDALRDWLLEFDRRVDPLAR